MGTKTLLKFVALTQFAAAVFVAPLVAEASGDVWTACGSEGGSCYINTSDTVLIRYGVSAKNNYFFFASEGESSVPCSNFNGDPSKGDSKQCWYNEDDSSLPTSWRECASERDDCATGSDEPLWVKYGAGDKWLYTIQSGTFSCDNDHFGWDPNKGTHKSCQVGSPPVLDSEPEWTTCATEGQTCDLATLDYNNTGTVIRYGAGDSWVNKIATQSDSIACNNDVFGDPAKGEHKACEVTGYLESAVLTSGKWNTVVSCEGSKCKTSYSITWGSTWSSSITNEQTWSVGVTQSVSAGIEIPPAKAESSTSYSAEYANSSSYQQSLSDSYDKSISVECGEAGSDDIKVIYQFSTASEAACLTGDGQCASTTHTQNFVCYTGDQPLPTTPQCLPNACVPGTYCTQCLTN